jgi:hypothetical protein
MEIEGHTPDVMTCTHLIKSCKDINVCVCLCVCVYVCVYVQNVCVYALVCVCVCVCIERDMRECIYVSIMLTYLHNICSAHSDSEFILISSSFRF